jgi:hypothetical protein
VPLPAGAGRDERVRPRAGGVACSGEHGYAVALRALGFDRAAAGMTRQPTYPPRLRE